MIARAMTFIKMPVPAKVKQIKLIDQAEVFEKFEGAVNGNPRDVGIDFLRAFENLAGIQVLRRAFHHLKHHAALAREADAPEAKLLLEATGSLMLIDAFAGRNPMWRSDSHSFHQGELYQSEDHKIGNSSMRL